MRHDQKILRDLAEHRRRRMRPNGRPCFNLTQAELASSTYVAMRLAKASKSQVEASSAATVAIPA